MPSCQVKGLNCKQAQVQLLQKFAQVASYVLWIWGGALCTGKQAQVQLLHTWAQVGNTVLRFLGSWELALAQAQVVSRPRFMAYIGPGCK